MERSEERNQGIDPPEPKVRPHTLDIPKVNAIQSVPHCLCMMAGGIDKVKHMLQSLPPLARQPGGEVVLQRVDGITVSLTSEFLGYSTNKPGLASGYLGQVCGMKLCLATVVPSLIVARIICRSPEIPWLSLVASNRPF